MQNNKTYQVNQTNPANTAGLSFFKTTWFAVAALMLMLGSIGSMQSALALEIMKWNRLPLAVPLIVGQERVIFVDKNVRVGVPSSLATKLRVQSTGGAVYLLAHTPIEPTRIQLQDAETGELILLDIAATSIDSSSGQNSSTQELEPIKIVEAEYVPPVRYGQQNRNQNDAGVIVSQGKATTVATTAAMATTGIGNDAVSIVKTDTPVPVVLTRYAAQSLYAPLRTVEPVAGISRVNMHRNLDLSTLMPLLSVEAKALAAWRLNDYWVTAILMRNKSQQHITLDPRLLQGDFVAATFQHPDLGARGDAADTTTLYLVTRGKGLEQSLIPNMPMVTRLPQVVVDSPALVNLGATKNGGDHEK